MSADDLSRKARARLRLGENPYAFVDFEDGRSSETPEVTPTPSRKESSDSHRQADLFSVAPPKEPITGQSGNPYARIDNTDNDEPARQRIAPALKSQGVSKMEFRRRSTRIFQQYIPELEGGRLRAYMREFIDRHESRSSQARFSLLQMLAKYDLSDIVGATSLFNREDISLTEEKLREIERSVGEEE